MFVLFSLSTHYHWGIWSHGHPLVFTPSNSRHSSSTLQYPQGHWPWVILIFWYIFVFDYCYFFTYCQYCHRWYTCMMLAGLPVNTTTVILKAIIHCLLTCIPGYLTLGHDLFYHRTTSWFYQASYYCSQHRKQSIVTVCHVVKLVSSSWPQLATAIFYSVWLTIIAATST